MAAPEFKLPTPPQDGLAWAATLRVEQQEGRRMVSAAWTTDLDKVSYLVEMPVVTALVPAFTKARQSARKTQCLANIKNLAVAMNMYLADYDRFPKADRWVEALAEYGVTERSLKCPDDDSDAKCSYAMNWGFSGKPASAIKDAANQVIFYETANPGDTPRGGKTDVASPPRHLGGNNFGFVDGHAKWSLEAAAEELQW
jgi:prepilin-type processing-associated H-X9-DG protein